MNFLNYKIECSPRRIFPYLVYRKTYPWFRWWSWMFSGNVHYWKFLSRHISLEQAEAAIKRDVAYQTVCEKEARIEEQKKFPRYYASNPETAISKVQIWRRENEYT